VSVYTKIDVEAFIGRGWPGVRPPKGRPQGLPVEDCFRPWEFVSARKRHQSIATPSPRRSPASRPKKH